MRDVGTRCYTQSTGMLEYQHNVEYQHIVGCLNLQIIYKLIFHKLITMRSKNGNWFMKVYITLCLNTVLKLVLRCGISEINWQSKYKFKW